MTAHAVEGDGPLLDGPLLDDSASAGGAFIGAEFVGVVVGSPGVAAAIDALGSIGGDSAVRGLVDLLKDERPEVRMEVLRACARSKDPRMIKLFQRVMEGDADQEVRTRAAEMFREVGGVVDREQTASARGHGRGRSTRFPWSSAPTNGRVWRPACANVPSFSTSS